MTKFSLPIFVFAALSYSATHVHAADCGNPSPEKPTIVEIVTFKTVAGLSESDFLKTVAQMETNFLCKTPGFVRRTLSKGEDGTWFDYVEWATMKEAATAMENSITNPDASAFVQSIIPESMAVQHWQLLSETK